MNHEKVPIDIGIEFGFSHCLGRGRLCSNQERNYILFNQLFVRYAESFSNRSRPSIRQPDLLGWKVNDSNDGPFHGAQMHVVVVSYISKDYTRLRGYGTWIDKDGDKVIWELLDTPPGASSSPQTIAGTGKYMDGKVLWNIPCSI